jgi:hypothetical protein
MAPVKTDIRSRDGLSGPAPPARPLPSAGRWPSHESPAFLDLLRRLARMTYTLPPALIGAVRIGAIAVVAWCGLASISGAQTVEWGAKAGINWSSVNAVPDYYDWLLCCHPLLPDARVEAGSSTGVNAGGFVAVPIHKWFGVQGELLFSRRRHRVDLQPYEAIQATFTRDYIEAAGLVKLELAAAGRHRLYVASGPVLGLRIGERAESSDPSVKRGNPETDIYVVQLLAYAAPEILRRSQTSWAIATGWTYRRALVEVRFTQGLQSIFKNRDGIVAGFVAAGGDEPTLRRLIADFGPFLESAKVRDVSVLAGFRF